MAELVFGIENKPTMAAFDLLDFSSASTASAAVRQRQMSFGQMGNSIVN